MNNQPDNPQQQTGAQNNDYVPPPPGGVNPQAPRVNDPQPMQAPQLEVDQKIASKKKQARIFLVSAIAFLVLFGGSILYLLLSVNSSDDDTAGRESLGLDETLKFDTNTLGLAIINYSESRGNFVISPESYAELRVSYITQDFADPRTDEPYVLTTSIPREGEMQYILGGICNEDDSIAQSEDTQNFAIRVLLEQEGLLYCLERSEVTQFPAVPAAN